VSVPTPLTRIVSPIRDFLHREAASGFVLLGAAVVGLAWANLFPGSYDDVWHTKLGREDLAHWAADGLMVLFFFVVGLEINRERRDGELTDPRAARLPALAAVGGMVVPALLFLAVAAGTGGERGWAVPAATDIAFAIGLLTLMGSRAPQSLRIFLLALAIVDDILAIVVIALFYTDELAPLAMLAAVALLVTYAVGTRRRVWWPLMLLVALGAWYAVLESGVHATIAGVALGLLTPAEQGPHESLAERLERRLHPYSAFLVLPVFAVASTGVALGGAGEAITSRVAIAVVVGLVVGKPVGVLLGTWVAVRARWSDLPADLTWRHIAAVGCVAGMGFTVALFVTGLAFTDPAFVVASKVGIVVGTFVSAALGAALLARTHRARVAAIDGAPAVVTAP
jgi:Na+:H+ antiporter, NhaA family